jgi:hypothetical protein
MYRLSRTFRKESIGGHCYCVEIKLLRYRYREKNSIGKIVTFTEAQQISYIVTISEAAKKLHRTIISVIESEQNIYR